VRTEVVKAVCWVARVGGWGSVGDEGMKVEEGEVGEGGGGGLLVRDLRAVPAEWRRRATS
jgi:hypothetical protein